MFKKPIQSSGNDRHYYCGGCGWGYQQWDVVVVVVVVVVDVRVERNATQEKLVVAPRSGSIQVWVARCVVAGLNR